VAGGEDAPESPEVHFEPVVKLEETVAVTTNEENETVEFKMYCFCRLLIIVEPSYSDFQRREMSGKNEALAM
jgi:hypothetical protein